MSVNAFFADSFFVIWDLALQARAVLAISQFEKCLVDTWKGVTFSVWESRWAGLKTWNNIYIFRIPDAELRRLWIPRTLTLVQSQFYGWDGFEIFVNQFQSHINLTNLAAELLASHDEVMDASWFRDVRAEGTHQPFQCWANFFKHLRQIIKLANGFAKQIQKVSQNDHVPHSSVPFHEMCSTCGHCISMKRNWRTQVSYVRVHVFGMFLKFNCTGDSPFRLWNHNSKKTVLCFRLVPHVPKCLSVLFTKEANVGNQNCRLKLMETLTPPVLGTGEEDQWSNPSSRQKCLRVIQFSSSRWHFAQSGFRARDKTCQWVSLIQTHVSLHATVVQ